MPKREPIPTAQLIEESGHFQIKLNQSTPIACVLVAAAMIEKSLMALLRAYFVQGLTKKEAAKKSIPTATVEDIFGVRGPLGSYRACADAAYCLGLISMDRLENLYQIGDIRNTFAHSHTIIDFDNQDIKTQCAKLKRISQTFSSPELREPLAKFIKSDEPAWSDPRYRFTAAALEMWMYLVGSALVIKRSVERKDYWWSHIE